MIQVPEQYAVEANHYLVAALTAAVEEKNWDAVESISSSLLDFALTYTRPKAPNS